MRPVVGGSPLGLARVAPTLLTSAIIATVSMRMECLIPSCLTSVHSIARLVGSGGTTGSFIIPFVGRCSCSRPTLRRTCGRSVASVL